MTNDERKLLLQVAVAVAEAEEEKAGKMKTTSHVAEEIRRLIDLVRPK